MRSMYAFTSSTVKKWRATSSMAPRWGKRGVSVTVPPAIRQARCWGVVRSMAAGSCWRIVWTPRKRPAGVRAVRVSRPGPERSR
ncbi:hypothetical protein GCM10010363_08140 [Streptomyces omiyaensis]|nr:hypothetical protein GCM10010363_08140 [Streptomyces omiyaensis]